MNDLGTIVPDVINNATAGSNLNFTAGTVSEDLTVTKSLTFSGINAGEGQMNETVPPTELTTFTGVITINAPNSNVVFDGVDFTGDALIIVEAANSVTLKNSRVHDINSRASVNFIETSGNASVRVIIENNYITNNTSINNFLNLKAPVGTSSVISKNNFATDACVGRAVAIFRTAPNAIIGINGNIFDTLTVLLSTQGSGSATIAMNDNTVNMAGLTADERELMLAQPDGNNTTTFKNIKVLVNRSTLPTDKVVIGYCRTSDPQLTQADMPKVTIDGVVQTSIPLTYEGGTPTYPVEIAGVGFDNLEDAYAAAVNGDVIVLNENITATAQFTMGKDITLQGDGTVTLTGIAGSPVITIPSGQKVKLDNVSLVGSNDGLHIMNGTSGSNTEVTIENSLNITNNGVTIEAAGTGSTPTLAFAKLILDNATISRSDEAADKPVILINDFYYGAFTQDFITNTGSTALVGTPMDSKYYMYTNPSLVPVVAIRPEGDGNGVNNFDYAQAYQDAGITANVSGTNVTITVDEATLTGKTLTELAPILAGGVDAAYGPSVGLIFATPENAKYARLYVDGASVEPSFTVDDTNISTGTPGGSYDALYPNIPVSGGTSFPVSGNSFAGSLLRYALLASDWQVSGGNLDSYTFRTDSTTWTVGFYDETGSLVSQSDITIQFNVQ